MGKVREIAMQPIAERFVAQLATGRWGLITNHSEILILGEPRPGDVIEARFSVNRARNLPESAVDLHFDFRRIDRNGLQERVAFGEMRTTWVALLGHGQVKAEPLPDYFRDFVDARTPLGAEIFRPDPMPEALRDPHRGPHRFRRPPGPVRGPNIALRVFDTCLQDSNMVGNIYFSNYYMWQARIVDHYVQPLVPDIYRAMGAMGELRCIRTRVDHLADAMPFEEIEVVMSLEELYDGGVTLGFDYFRIQPDQTRQKLAFGEQECVWLAKKKGETVVSQLPAALMEDLRRRTG
jgi:acyl-CoA thioesterase FadM